MASLAEANNRSLPPLPRLRRADPGLLPSFRLTDRDAQILEAIYRYRALTTPQVQALFFPTSAEDEANSRCQRRLQLLFHAGYLWRQELPSRLSEGRRPLLYRLDRKGARWLAQRQGIVLRELDWSPRERHASPLFLDHLLATNQVRIALVLAAQAQGWQITHWNDDRDLRRDQAQRTVTLSGPHGAPRRVAIVPDGYFVLDAGRYAYHNFLEIDMGTVTGEAGAWGRRDWRRKVAAYVEFARSGQYEAQFGVRSWRVLTVTTGEARLKSLAGITAAAGGDQHFWFTILDRITPTSAMIEPIWHVAGVAEIRPLAW